MRSICSHCGETHAEWPPDLGFQRPDEVWVLDEDAATSRVKANNDLCILDERRHFIRGILFVPVRNIDESWGIGLWVEVEKLHFDRYCDHYDEDGTSEPRFPGSIANALRAFPGALGATVEIQLGSSTERPSLWFCEGSSVDLAVAQLGGLDDAQLHAALRIEQPHRYP